MLLLKVDDSYQFHDLIKLIISMTNSPRLVLLFGLWSSCSWETVTMLKGGHSCFSIGSVLLGCIQCCPLHKCQYIASIVDCTLVRSAIASFKDLATVALENSTNQTADVFLEDQRQPPLDLEGRSPQNV